MVDKEQPVSPPYYDEDEGNAEDYVEYRPEEEE